MVNESLDAYLDNHDDLLQCKILDPACGSGAFPCEVMNIIMHRFEEDIKEREDRQLSPQERYRTKLKIVRDVIHGIDIQPMAVQITLLRFFLSLIQDIIPEKGKANCGIEPLPNLEAKFVCADALIGLKKENGQRLLESPKVTETIKDLQSLRGDYFMASSVQEKERLRKYDSTLRRVLVDLMEGVFTHDTTEKLAAWNPYNPSQSASFFDPVWMFGIDKFDIVIGNPPYIQLQKRGGALAKQYENCGYETLVRAGDIYCLFYERGWQLLKERGHLCIITSNKWMRAGYGESLRKFLSEKTNPLLLLDFAGTKVFESETVDVNILLFAKEKNHNRTATKIVQSVAELKKLKKQKKNMMSMSFSSSPWVIMSSIEQSIKRKVEAVCRPLKIWDIRINFGIKTGFNGAFIIDGAKKAELIAADPKSAEIIKPLLRGRDIKRFGYDFADLWLIATFPALNIDIEKFPAVKDHLLSFGYDRLKQTGERGSRKKSNNKWFETQDTIAFWKEFDKPKMVWKRVGSILRFCLDEKKHWVLDSTCFATGKHLKYLVAVLNSKFGNYLLQQSPKTGTGDLLVSVQAIKPIKIPLPPIETERKIENLLQKKDYASIDRLVYELYGLTDKEIVFVEGGV
jgi:hypothetical protein